MKERRTVLVAEDEKINRMILQKILSDDYEVVETCNGQEALNYLKEHRQEISAVLLDLVMPVLDGISFLGACRDVPEYQDLPIIVATGRSDNSEEKACLALGAWDFVSKPYDADILRFRLKNAIDRSRLAVLKDLQHLADFDPVSEIYNKQKFLSVTRKMLDSHPEIKFVAIHFDIEKFKLINSFFGEEEGNRFIRYAASNLEQYGKNHPLFTYGHLSADIFLICLPFESKETVIDALDRARTVLQDYPLDFDIVPNFGLMVIENPAMEISRIFDQADMASQHSKGNYIQSYAFYEESMGEAMIREQNIINSMTSALEEGQFVVYFQPKYDLHDNSVSGAEALVRWKRPGYGMVSPGEFIPIFERNGFITKLDFYVWEQVCILLKKWKDEGKKPFPVSVNLSRVSLNNPKLEEFLSSLIKRYEIAPELLQLELTESAYTSNPTMIREMIERLKKSEFTILMDDFGSGYSSLNTLKDIPVDVLKVDMKFLSETKNSSRGESILASVIHMAKWLNMPVIVEGVETSEQVHFLREVGCEYVQGYYFARPMPVEQYEALAFHGEGETPRTETPAPTGADRLWDKTSQMESLFSSIMQAAAVYEFSSDHVEVMRVNDAYYDLFGYRDLDNASESFLHRIDEEYEAILLNAFEVAADTLGVSECEIRRTANGRPMWVQMKLKYIGRVGTKDVIFGILTDVTAQKQIDRELQKYRSAMSAADRERQRILIVDDLEVNRAVLSSIFEGKYDLLEAENGEEAFRILKEQQNQVDLILLDLMMPVMDGPSFLKQKLKNPETADIPTVIITADDSEEQQIRILDMGANDYIVKPFVPEVVQRRVCNVLESSRGFGRMLQQSQRDSLTGLFKPEPAKAMMQKRVESSSGLQAMLLVDIDNLRSVNEQQGSEAGDRCLRAFADMLHASFRRSDIIARYEGDEFIILVSSAPSTEFIAKRCELLLQGSVEATGLESSIGVAVAARGEYSVMELIEHADRALYEAKQRGKNQFVIYQEGEETAR